MGHNLVCLFVRLFVYMYVPPLSLFVHLYVRPPILVCLFVCMYVPPSKFVCSFVCTSPHPTLVVRLYVRPPLNLLRLSKTKGECSDYIISPIYFSTILNKRLWDGAEPPNSKSEELAFLALMHAK